MNQSWGRGVWGSGTMTHSCCVSERRTRPAVSRRRTRGLVNKPELGVFYREGQCDSSMSIMTRYTLLYGSSSPHPPLTTSPPQHHLPLLSAFKAVFVSGARAQARAPNCSLCMYKYIMYVCVKCLCILCVYEFMHTCVYVCRYICYRQRLESRGFDTMMILDDSTDIIKIALICHSLALVIEYTEVCI